MQPRIARTVPVAARRPDPNRDRKHFAWVKTLPCVVCMRRGPSDPHHLKRAAHEGVKGGARKHPDRFAIPLCRVHHDAAEGKGKNLDPDANGDDEVYFAAKGINARSVCEALYRVSGDDIKGLRIIFRARAR